MWKKSTPVSSEYQNALRPPVVRNLGSGRAAGSQDCIVSYFAPRSDLTVKRGLNDCDNTRLERVPHPSVVVSTLLHRHSGRLSSSCSVASFFSVVSSVRTSRESTVQCRCMTALPWRHPCLVVMEVWRKEVAAFRGG